MLLNYLSVTLKFCSMLCGRKINKKKRVVDAHENKWPEKEKKKSGRYGK